MSDGLQRALQGGMPIVRTALALGGARVYSSVSVTVNDVTATAVPFNAELFDDSEYHSTSSNTSRMTIPATGRYLIGGQFLFNSDATGFRQVSLRVNGATYIVIDIRPAASGSETVGEAVTVYELTVGDYVEVIVYQDSGSNMSVAAANHYTAQFWIWRLA